MASPQLMSSTHFTKSQNQTRPVIEYYEAQAKGTPIAEVERSLGISEVTLHRWRAEYGAVDRDAVRRMKELEKENARLKRLVAEKELDILILKDVAKGEF